VGRILATLTDRLSSGHSVVAERPDDVASEDFGTALASDGKTLVVGTGTKLADADGVGAAYVFEQTAGTTWSRVAKLAQPSGARTRSSFGAAVAVDKDVLVVSSPDEHDASAVPDVGALYVFVRGASTSWSLDTRLELAAGDGVTTCLAGARAAVGSNLSAAADVLAHGTSGWAAEPAVAAPASPSLVACDGARIGVVSLNANRANGERSVFVYESAAGAPTLGKTEVPLGPSSTGGFAMAGGNLFVGVAGSPGRVRIEATGALAGEPCTVDTACVSTYCVDGVCCNSACGGGDTTDCQACSRAAGAALDGACGPVAATYVCRKARDACDVADRCDGTNPRCPVDLVAPNGTPCNGGTCSAGACVADPRGGSTPPGTPEGGEQDATEQRGCATARGRVSVDVGLLGLAMVIVTRSRRRRSERPRR
jgi:hypothetical protein